MNAAVAAQSAAYYKVAQAQHALDAAAHDVELYRGSEARIVLDAYPRMWSGEGGVYCQPSAIHAQNRRD